MLCVKHKAFCLLVEHITVDGAHKTSVSAAMIGGMLLFSELPKRVNDDTKDHIHEADIDDEKDGEVVEVPNKVSGSIFISGRLSDEHISHTPGRPRPQGKDGGETVPDSHTQILPYFSVAIVVE